VLGTGKKMFSKLEKYLF